MRDILSIIQAFSETVAKNLPIMPISPDPNHIKQLQTNLDRLWNSPAHKMGDMKMEPLRTQNSHQGVYVVTDPNDEEVVYVGKTNGGTIEKGVADRIWGHCNTGSDLQGNLGLGPEEMKRYHVRTVPIPEPRERGLTELYGIAVHGPKGNRFGQGRSPIDLDDPSAPDRGTNRGKQWCWRQTAKQVIGRMLRSPNMRAKSLIRANNEPHTCETLDSFLSGVS